MAWTKNIEITKPPDTGESPSLGASRIRDWKNAVCERLTNWIYSFKTDDSETKEGLKKAPLNTGSAPTQEADKIIVYAKDVAGIAELFARDENGNEIQITSGGQVKSSGFASKVRTYRSGEQGVPSGTWTKVQFNAENYDGLGEYSTSTYKFTAEATGYYLLTVNILMDLGFADKRMDIDIYKNGAFLYRTVSCQSLSYGPSIVVSDILSLNATDYIEVYVWHNAGVDRNVKANSYMAIHRLS